MAATSAVNRHSIGAIPTLASIQALGYDVKWQETHDRHRLYQAVGPSGSIVGSVGDDNYLGFQTQAEALEYLAADTTFIAAVSAAGGVAEWPGKDSHPISHGPGEQGGISGNFHASQEALHP